MLARASRLQLLLCHAHCACDRPRSYRRRCGDGRPREVPGAACRRVEDNLDLDVLSWWKARDHDKAADPASGRPSGLPDLAKMAAQYLGRPASSAGVERMFSKAGKLHDDLKQKQTDDTLEHSLFAAANTR